MQIYTRPILHSIIQEVCKQAHTQAYNNMKMPSAVYDVDVEKEMTF